MTTGFFFKCPIGKQISLLLNKVFLSIKHVHLHYEILQRPTSSSPEGEQEREGEREKKGFKIFEIKKKENREREECSFFKHLIVLFA